LAFLSDGDTTIRVLARPKSTPASRLSSALHVASSLIFFPTHATIMLLDRTIQLGDLPIRLPRSLILFMSYRPIQHPRRKGLQHAMHARVSSRPPASGCHQRCLERFGIPSRRAGCNPLPQGPPGHEGLKHSLPHKVAHGERDHGHIRPVLMPTRGYVTPSRVTFHQVATPYSSEWISIHIYLLKRLL